MPFSMKISKEQIKGLEVLPPNHYELKLISFAPKISKNGDSYSLNPCMEVINHPDFAGRKVFDSLNSKGAWTWPAFVEAFGLTMEGNDAEGYSIPGQWNGNPAVFNENDPATWVYKGPLVGRTGKAEIYVDNYNGKDNNKVKTYFRHPSLVGVV